LKRGGTHAQGMLILRAKSLSVIRKKILFNVMNHKPIYLNKIIPTNRIITYRFTNHKIQFDLLFRVGKKKGDFKNTNQHCRYTANFAYKT
jgi:hypothetical protein